MKVTLFIALVGMLLCGYSQQAEIDSIKQVLPDQEPMDQVRSLNELSWYYKNFDVDSSELFERQALSISKRLNSPGAISTSYNNLASAFQAKGLFDSALYYHNQSFLMKQELGDSIGMAASYNNLGIAYDEKGDYAKALQNYFLALEIYERDGSDLFKIAMVLGNIGIVYKKQNEYDEVLDYYGRALEIYKEAGSVFGQSVTQGNMSSVMLLTGDYDAAIEFASSAMEKYKSQGYLRYVPYMQHNLGIAYDSLGQLTKAAELFTQSINGHIETDNQYELASSLIGLAGVLRKQGNYQEGIDRARRGLDLAQTLGAKEFITRAELELSLIYSNVGNHKNAYQHLRSYGIMKDTLFEEAKTKQIFELQTQYETEKKEQQIELQEAQLSQQDAKLRLNNALLIASGVTLVLILGLALLNRSRLRKKRQIAEQQERINIQQATLDATISSQEKERARYARDLHDGFGQMISILNLNLKNLGENAKPDERQEVFEESEKVINEMYGELKSICFDLMPQTLVKQGLTQALDEFVSRVNKADNVFIETNFFGLEDRLNDVEEISLYRITQEWVNNILKYSDATKVTIQVTRDEDELNLIIEDDGQGFDPKQLENGKGNGWRNIQTRAKLINGNVELDTTPGQKGNTLIIQCDKTENVTKSIKNTVDTV